MSSITAGKHRGRSRIPVAVWALVTAAWLLTYLIPSARRMMLDVVASFLLNFVVTGLLWRASRQSTDARVFWRLLAAGWGLNLAGNVAWGVYDTVTGRSLPPLSWLDVIYVTRYAFVMVAFWRFAGRAAGLRWVGLIAFVLAAIAMTWLVVLRPALASVTFTASFLYNFVGVAMYVLLDFGLLYLALVAWARAADRWRGVIGLLTLAVVSYGAANLINVNVRLDLPQTTAFLMGILWPLSDALTGLAAVWALQWERRPSVEMATLRG